MQDVIFEYGTEGLKFLYWDLLFK